MTLLDRQREVVGYLEKGFPELDLKGMPLISASASVGNFSQENFVLPVTEGPKDHGSDGIAQWRLDRLDGPSGLKNWTSHNGMDWRTLKAQSAFYLWELDNDTRYMSLIRDLRDGKKRLETLTANICWIYERPAKSAANLEKRISHAKSIYQIISQERGLDTAKTGGAAVGGGLITNGIANATHGGSTTVSVFSILFGLTTVIGPWVLEHFRKPVLSTHIDEKEEILQPTEAIQPSSVPIEIKIANVRALQIKLEEAVKDLREALKVAREKVEAERSLLDATEAGITDIKTIPVEVR